MIEGVEAVGRGREQLIIESVPGFKHVIMLSRFPNM